MGIFMNQNEKPIVSETAATEESSGKMVPDQTVLDDQTAENPTSLPEEVSITHTEEELVQSITIYERYKGRLTKSIIQTVILAAVIVYSLIAFFAIGMDEIGSLVLAVLAALIIGVIWIAAPIRFRHMAQFQMERKKDLHVFVYPHGLSFGDDENITPFTFYRGIVKENMIVIFLAGDQLICLPRRAFSQPAWEILSANITSAKK